MSMSVLTATTVTVSAVKELHFKQCKCCGRYSNRNFIKKPWVPKDLRVCALCYIQHENDIRNRPWKVREKIKLANVARELTNKTLMEINDEVN
jgi:hypothetical protein